MAPAGRILVGDIGRPPGVRGLVKLRSFTADPAAIATYGPLTDETGPRVFAVTLLAEGPPERLVPFTRAAVPVVDIAGGRVVVVPPEEVVVPPQPGDAEDAA